MVKDARSAVDFLYCHSEQGIGNSTCSSWANGGDLKKIPLVDFDRVFLMGYCEPGLRWLGAKKKPTGGFNCCHTCCLRVQTSRLFS